jgi:RND family efflux transporter MFP subunit
MIHYRAVRVLSAMIIRLTILALAASAVAACSEQGGGSRGEGERASQPQAVRVVAQEVVLEREAERIEALGTARARASATIFAETAGEVEAVSFTAGDRVEAGDVLLQLEADDERLDVRLAQVAVREAEQLLARYRRIEDTGAVSDSQIDEAETALDAARIELEQARVALERRTVRAPFSGYVGLTDIDAGARITPTTEITELDDRSVLFVDFDPPEQVFGRIGVGDVFQAAPFAGAGRSYEARIINVDSRIDPSARTFTVRAELDNAADALRPGMSFRVGFDLLSGERPVVPEVAIIWGGDGAYVWAVREGRAVDVPITLVQRREGRVLVSGDLQPGDLVVAEGIQRVREGAPIEIIETRQARTRTSGSGAPAAAATGGAFGE